MKLVFVLPTAVLLATVAGTFPPALLAQAPSQQPKSPTPDATNNSAAPQQTRLAYIGIQMVTLTPDTAQEINKNFNIDLQVPEKEGVLVFRVNPDTPAARAGLRQGDFIVQVEEQPVTTAEQVQQKVANSQVGQSLSFIVQRGDQKIPLSVRLEKRPASDRKD